MFYLLEVEDFVRVEPKHFGLPTKEAIEKQHLEGSPPTVGEPAVVGEAERRQ